MNLFNVEDSLEEFDIQYLEAYNQVLNKRFQDEGSNRNQIEGSVSSTAQELTLSSPLLDKQDMARFAGDRFTEAELLDTCLQNISATIRVAPKTLRKTSGNMRPPLKPSVTIESIDTITRSRKPKHHSSSNSPDCYPNSTSTRSAISTNCYVGNPFYKKNITQEIKSMPTIPTVSSFNFDLDRTPQIRASPEDRDTCCKKRKVSNKSALHLVVDECEHLDRSGSATSISSFNSILSLSENQYDDFDFDYFLSQEPANIFSDDY